MVIKTQLLVSNDTRKEFVKIFPKTLERCFYQYQDKINNNNAYGEFRCENNKIMKNINSEFVSHKIIHQSLEFYNNELYWNGIVEILPNTIHFTAIKNQIENKLPISLVPRGSGDYQISESGFFYVSDEFEIICFDIDFLVSSKIEIINNASVSEFEKIIKIT